MNKNNFIVCCLKDNLSGQLSAPELFESIPVAMRYYKDKYKNHCGAPDLYVCSLGNFDLELGLINCSLALVGKLYPDLIENDSTLHVEA